MLWFNWSYLVVLWPSISSLMRPLEGTAFPELHLSAHLIPVPTWAHLSLILSSRTFQKRFLTKPLRWSISLDALTIRLFWLPCLLWWLWFNCWLLRLPLWLVKFSWTTCVCSCNFGFWLCYSFSSSWSILSFSLFSLIKGFLLFSALCLRLSPLAPHLSHHLCRRSTFTNNTLKYGCRSFTTYCIFSILSVNED